MLIKVYCIDSFILRTINGTFVNVVFDSEYIYEIKMSTGSFACFSQIVSSFISKRNWTWPRVVQFRAGVIARVISKSGERKVRGRLENTSAIIP